MQSKIISIADLNKSVKKSFKGIRNHNETALRSLDDRMPDKTSSKLHARFAIPDDKNTSMKIKQAHKFFIAEDSLDQELQQDVTMQPKTTKHILPPLRPIQPFHLKSTTHQSHSPESFHKSMLSQKNWETCKMLTSRDVSYVLDQEKREKIGKSKETLEKEELFH